MKESCSLKKWPLLMLLMFLQPMAYAEVDAGYEAANGVSGTCTTNKNVPDAFGGTNSQGNPLGGFAACNCTSYVAYRLRLNDVKLDNELFVNWNWGNTSIHWSDAKFWNDSNTAGTAGIREDKYPAVGSVAHWETAGGTGHVAYVQHVFTHPNDGRVTSIGVMEYNWTSPHLYTYRRIGHGRGSGYPTSFLHFEEKGTDASTTNATCATGLSSSPSGASAGAFCWKHNGSNASCGSASAYYYYDYRHCQKYTVSSGYCNEVGTNPGYTIHIGSWYPEPIDPAAWGNDFAACDSSGSLSYGNSREVSGRLPPQRAKFWRGILNTIN